MLCYNGPHHCKPVHTPLCISTAYLVVRICQGAVPLPSLPQFLVHLNLPPVPPQEDSKGYGQAKDEQNHGCNRHCPHASVWSTRDPTYYGWLSLHGPHIATVGDAVEWRQRRAGNNYTLVIVLQHGHVSGLNLTGVTALNITQAGLYFNCWQRYATDRGTA